MDYPDSDMVKRTRGKLMTHAQRLENVRQHGIDLDAILHIAPLRETPQRVIRTRYFADGAYTVVTLVQYLSETGHIKPDFRLKVYVSRPYTHSPMATTTTFEGQYSIDEVIAYLALDKVSPETLQWKDETRYSPLVVVGDVLRNLH